MFKVGSVINGYSTSKVLYKQKKEVNYIFAIDYFLNN